MPVAAHLPRLPAGKKGFLPISQGQDHSLHLKTVGFPFISKANRDEHLYNRIFVLFFQLSKRYAFVLHDFCREKIQRQNRQLLIIQDEQATAGDGVEGLPFCIADGSPFWSYRGQPTLGRFFYLKETWVENSLSIRISFGASKQSVINAGKRSVRCKWLQHLPNFFSIRLFED